MVTNRTWFLAAPSLVPSASDGGTRESGCPPEINYERLFDLCARPQAVVSLRGEILDCNENFCSLVGYPKETLKQFSIFTITPENEIVKTQGIITEMLSHCENSKDREPIFKSFRKAIMAHGKYLELNVSTSLIRDEAGRPEYFLSTVTDATPINMVAENDKRCAEESLHGDTSFSAHRNSDTSPSTYRAITAPFKELYSDVSLDAFQQDSTLRQGELSFRDGDVTGSSASSPCVDNSPCSQTSTC